MNPLAIFVGIVLCGFGVWVLVRRLQGRHEEFAKLTMLKERIGPHAGSALHYVTYVGLPLLLGISMVVQGYTGITFAQWIRESMGRQVTPQNGMSSSKCGGSSSAPTARRPKRYSMYLLALT